MDGCVFCRIVRGEIPSKKVYEDAQVLAFYDTAPQAPVHVLIVPKAHTESLVTASALDDQLLSHLLRTAAEVARTLSVDQSGFRIVSNCGTFGCQTVPHLHIHVLGGKQLSGEMV